MLVDNFTTPSEGGGSATARVELRGGGRGVVVSPRRWWHWVPVLRGGDVGVGAGGCTEKATWQGLMMQRRWWWIGEQGDLNMWTSQHGEGGPRLAEA
jgi:hypothetical protein